VPRHPHDDRIAGTELSDRILACGGDDRVDAGPGDDEVSGGGGRDTVAGGRGDDLRGRRAGGRISDRAGSDDVVSCGRSNNDKISSDPGDSLVGCEGFAEIPVR
jgi:Ca2+-binding RTX toxin-like protein